MDSRDPDVEHSHSTISYTANFSSYDYDADAPQIDLSGTRPPADLIEDMTKSQLDSHDDPEFVRLWKKIADLQRTASGERAGVPPHHIDAEAEFHTLVSEARKLSVNALKLAWDKTFAATDQADWKGSEGVIAPDGMSVTYTPSAPYAKSEQDSSVKESKRSVGHSTSTERVPLWSQHI